MGKAMRIARSLGALGFAALVACGGGDSAPEVTADRPGRSTPLLDPTITVPRAVELGSCPPDLQKNADDGSLDFTPLRGRLHAADLTWWRAERIEQAVGATPTTTPQDRSVPVSLVGVRPVVAGTPAPTAARLYGPSWPQVALANESGHSFFVARQSNGLLQSVVAVDAQGRIGFVGQCEVVMATGTMQDFILAVRGGTVAAGLPQGATAEAVFAAVVDPGTPVAAAFRSWGGRKPMTWIDTPPDRRSIDPDNTPADVMGTLRRLPVAIALPVEWRSRDDLTFCTRTSLAWGDCTALDAGPATEPIAVVAYVRPGEGFELWALDGQAAFDRPVARLAGISAAAVDQRLGSGGALQMKPAGAGSLDELINQARSGRAALVEGP